MKRLIRFALRLGALVAAAAIVIKLLEDDEPLAPIASWVEPEGGVCPASHPVKAKLSTKVYRTPTSPGYDKSTPDRCYASEAAAIADGFREAKR